MKPTVETQDTSDAGRHNYQFLCAFFKIPNRPLNMPTYMTTFSYFGHFSLWKIHRLVMYTKVHYDI